MELLFLLLVVVPLSVVFHLTNDLIDVVFSPTVLMVTAGVLILVLLSI